MKTIPIYRIRIEGILDPSWSDWFDDLVISYEDQEVSVLTGPISDQAALHGVLNKIRDIGLTLLEVSMQTAETDNDEET